MTDTILWISGASAGLGSGLARYQPWPGARVINLDRADAPGIETIRFDLEKPDTWERVAAHFAQTLAGFRGRAVFLQNAFAQLGMGVIGRLDRAAYGRGLVANFAAPIMLGEAFLRALPEDVAEGGLMMMSSGAGARPLVGQSGYGATKAGIEFWVRVAREEFRPRRNTWIVAVRPGLVKTATALSQLNADPKLYPRVGALAGVFDRIGVDIDTGAQRIWSRLPPKPEEEVIAFDRAAVAAP